jgi:hypothetical protein
MTEIKTIFSLRLLRWFCPDHLYEEIEGDLIQKFERDIKLVWREASKAEITYGM